MNPASPPALSACAGLLPLLALILPLITSLILLLLRRRVHLLLWIAWTAACLHLLILWCCLQALQEGLVLDCLLLPLLPGLELALKPDTLGFALAFPVSVFWPLLATFLQTLPNRQPAFLLTLAGYQTCLALAVSAATGMAFAGNLPTLSLGYCLLICSSCPFLIADKRLDEAVGSPLRRHLIALLAPALLLLPAMALLSTLNGALDFAASSKGLLDGHKPGLLHCLLFLFCLFGFAANGAMPCHRWLFACLDAPLPFFALALALVLGNAGLFASGRIMLFMFGSSMEVLHLDLVVFVLWGSMAVLAALLSLFKDSLLERLNWSTVSQSACVVLGLALDSREAQAGALLLLICHSTAKLTALLASAPLLARSGSARIQAMTGLGRELPLPASLLTLGVLSLGGIPPLAGFAALWPLLKGALAAQQPAVAVILASVAVLQLAAFAPVIQTLFFAHPAQISRPDSSTALRPGLLWPLVLAGALVLLPGLLPASTLRTTLEILRPW